MLKSFFGSNHHGYEFKFEGMTFDVDFWSHANRRLRERLVNRSLVHDAIHRAIDDIIDCRLGQRFALISADIKQIVIGFLKSEGADDYSIQIVTLIDDDELRNSDKYADTMEINVG